MSTLVKKIQRVELGHNARCDFLKDICFANMFFKQDGLRDLFESRFFPGVSREMFFVDLKQTRIATIGKTVVRIEWICQLPFWDVVWWEER